VSEQGISPPPGFYDDGTGAQRWWDGTNWTEHRNGALAPNAAGDAESKVISWTATIGYILAALLPFIGFFVGLALIARKDRHGIGVVLLSTVAFFAYIYAFAR